MRILTILALVAAFKCTGATAKTCEKYCTPGVSKACGAGCIPLTSNCTKSWTTACNDEKPVKPKKTYDNPQHVDQRPGTETKSN